MVSHASRYVDSSSVERARLTLVCVCTELLRYSSASGVLESIPESLQAHHRVKGIDGVLVSCEEEPMVPIGRHTRNCDTIHAAFEEDTEGVDLSAFGC